MAEDVSQSKTSGASRTDWQVVTLAGIGVLAIVIAFVVSVIEFNKVLHPSQTIVALTGAVAAPVGTLIAALAGQRQGARGREQAEQRAFAAGQHAATK